MNTMVQSHPQPSRTTRGSAPVLHTTVVCTYMVEVVKHNWWSTFTHGSVANINSIRLNFVVMSDGSQNQVTELRSRTVLSIFQVTHTRTYVSDRAVLSVRSGTFLLESTHGIFFGCSRAETSNLTGLMTNTSVSIRVPLK